MEENKKKSVRIACKVLGFLLTCAAALVGLYYAVRPKIPDANIRYRTYDSCKIFAEPKNSLDVLFVGHSHVYSSISPLQMYEQYGIAGYNCAQPDLMPWQTREILHGVLQKQHPKYIFLDVNEFFCDTKALKQKVRKKYWILNLFPFIEIHGNWKTGFNLPPRDAQKGYVIRQKSRPYKGDKSQKTDKVYKMQRKYEKGLYDTAALCKQYDIPLVLFQAPSRRFWSYDRYNCMQKLADDLQLPYFEMNLDEHADAIDIDWALDTEDGGDHMNYWGAVKTTAYLGKWIREHYDLPDRRGDPAYAAWEDDLKTFNRIKPQDRTPKGGKEKADVA